jgi:hypothetical protein
MLLPRSGKRNLLAETAPTLDSDSRKCDSLGANYEKGFRAMFRGPFSFVVTSIFVDETPNSLLDERARARFARNKTNRRAEPPETP